MASIHALDRLIGNDYPELLTDAEVRAFEQVPYADRVAAESTYGIGWAKAQSAVPTISPPTQ